MYGCDSWTIKKAECQRIDSFELWCWRLLRVPWTARRSNQSIQKISPGCSLEGLMLKLKLQYFGLLMWRADSLEKTLILGKIEGRRRRGWHRMRWLDGITNSMNMSLGKIQGWWWTGRPGMLWYMESQRVGHDWATELNSSKLPRARKTRKSQKKLSQLGDQRIVMTECSVTSWNNRSTAYNSRTWKQPGCPSADGWTRKLWYIYPMEYYSAIKKNSFESVLMRWMKLEPIIQSEVSQKDKHQYSILTHIYGI